MELRKIQITGGSTHVISLPKKWVDRSNLRRGDTIAIHEEPDASLLLIPHNERRPERRPIPVRLPPNATPDDVVRRLVGAYLAGADEIRISTEGHMDPRVREIVRSVARDLVGVEVVDETADAMVLQDLVGISDIELTKTITRMHRIARLMFDDALAAVQSGDKQAAAAVRARDDELDRLEWMVSKQMHGLLEQPRLAARLNVRPAEALNFFLVSRTLERMGDHASKICKNLLELESEAPPSIVESLVGQATRVRAVWDDAFNAIKRADFELGSKASDAGKRAATWRAEFQNMLRRLDPSAVSSLTLIADSVDRVRGYAVDISEIAMNHTFQRSA